MRWIALLLTLTSLACGGSSPTAPSAPPVVTPQTFTLSGTLTTTNSGAPVTAAIDYGLGTTTTDPSGRFAITGPLGTSTLTLRISGAGLIDRRTYATAGTRTVNLDAIAESGFDLTFYRELVRNTFDTPTTMQPLRRWTRNPNVYIQTHDQISAATVDMIEREARAMVPTWSAGRLSVATVERGAGTRANEPGWLTVDWDAAAVNCGVSDIGREGGRVTLAAGQSRCACGGFAIAPTAIRHEFGHAMGFWHTDNQAEVMYPTYAICDRQPSARELAHAAIAYKRPVGNLDPDTDPSGAVNLAPLRIH